MLCVVIAPKHVLHPVGAVEHAHAQSLADFVEAIEKHRLAFPIGVEALLQEMIVLQHVFVQAPGVFGQTERCIWTLPLRQINRIDLGIADRHRRMLRIDVHRRGVQFEFRLGAR